MITNTYDKNVLHITTVSGEKITKNQKKIHSLAHFYGRKSRLRGLAQNSVGGGQLWFLTNSCTDERCANVCCRLVRPDLSLEFSRASS